MTTAKESGRKDHQIISYYTLRKLIGFAGISLPFLLWLSNGLINEQWRTEFSISDYYNDPTSGDIFVGILFALAFFLFSYRGYETVDNRVATAGCFCALGVALCPTTSSIKAVFILHFIFAVLLFTVFILFSIWLFRKSSGHPSRQKDNRNRVYLVCGMIMIVCILLIALFSIPGLATAWSKKYHPIFWLESLALLAFGFSWITKAELLFKESNEKNRA